MGCIYCAKNTINGKCYVGQTLNTLIYRKMQHEAHAKAGSPYIFSRALRKYGFDAFVWSIVYDGLDDHELNFFEQIAIRNLKTLSPDGYNMMTGGGSGGRHSQESKDKVSVGNKGKKRSEEFKRRVSEVHTGRKDKPETTIKRQLANRGKKLSEAAKKKISEAGRGRPCSEITRQRRSESIKRRHAEDPEIRISVAIKNREVQKGRKLTEQHIEKIREAAKRRGKVNQTPEQRKLISERTKKGYYLKRARRHEQYMPTCYI